MPVDAFLELFNQAAYAFSRAADVARRQHNFDKAQLAQNWCRRVLIEAAQLTASPTAPPAAASTDRPNRPRPRKPASAFRPLSHNWAARLRQRLLRQPSHQQKASQCALGFKCQTDDLVDAARRHSWFVCKPPPKGGGWRIALADDAVQDPPPAAIVIPPAVLIAPQPQTHDPA